VTLARKRLFPKEDAFDDGTPAKNPKIDVFAQIAARSKSYRPAREVLRRVRAVPTILPAVDWKLRVGGWPIDRVAFAHGPSIAGKTKFMHALGYSFLRRGHIYAPMDAEHTTPITWLEQLFGEYADSSRFIASRPTTYEQGVDDVNRVAEAVAEMREKGRIPPETTCLFAVDSIGSLVPQDIQEKIRKHAAESKEGSVDGMRGASGMIQAALNKAWLRQLVPLMSATGCAILFIVRETKKQNATADEKRFGTDWKVTGGESLMYEGSVEIRVSDAKILREDPEDYKSAMVGERHSVEIRKTKVSARQDKVEHAFFNTSNGAWTPEGFDRVRDLLELGIEFGLVKQAGAWLSFGGKRFQGTERFLRKAEPELVDELEAACRGKFGDIDKVADVVGQEVKA
jgi:recombination protein RecA